MTLKHITCPECGAGLKSASGFNPGQTATCPKCETDFEVTGPGEGRPPDDEDYAPKKKKKKKAADDDGGEEWSYKKSWIRYAVLGVLVVVMLLLGYMLYQKRQREKEEARANTDAVPRSTVVQRG